MKMKQTLPLILCAMSLIFSMNLKASAETTTQGEVLVILAKESEGKKDSKLKGISALQKPPFNAFKSLEVLSTSQITLAQGSSVETNLPNKDKLKITLEKILEDGRFKVQVSISKTQKKDFLPLLQVKASPGKHFFVAGQKFKDGTLITGIKIEAPKTKAPVKKK